MKTLAKTVKTCAVITVLSAIAAFITGIIFENAKLTSYFLGMFVVLSLINLNIYIILGILKNISMIKLINIITQIIIVLGCCAILIFTLSIAIAFAKNDFATITNIYNYIYMLNVSMKLNHITFMAIILMLLNMINNTI